MDNVPAHVLVRIQCDLTSQQAVWCPNPLVDSMILDGALPCTQVILLPQLSEELGNRNVALYLAQIIIVLRQDFSVCSSGLELNNL